LQKEGLDAFEYEAVYWSDKPQISMIEAEKLLAEAKKHDILLSMHASYYINLCGEEAVVERSKKRLLTCVLAADWMRARVVVFHPGYYSGQPPQIAREKISKAINELVETMQSLGIKQVHLGPETAGKLSQYGSIDEILDLCEATEQTSPVVDWAHVHARGNGSLKTIDDFRKTLEKVDGRLGSEAAKSLHCHFTGVEFNASGERRHHPIGGAHGPDFQLLANLIVELGLAPTIISESPLLDIDAMKMRSVFKNTLRENRNRAIANATKEG
jgi:deoxyribonuclease-4